MTNTKTDYKKEIINTIRSMAGKYSVYEIFADWIKLIAFALLQQIDFKDEREREYCELINKYDKKDQSKLFEMFAWLTEWADEEMTDMLGYIYMHLEMGSKAHGQFFTPYHICQMMAKIQTYENKNYISNEPTCGAGGNIIALAEAMKEQGINYQQKLLAICQDIDQKAVFMAYVQMSLYGIPAICFQSDTLRDPNGNESSTGKMMTYGYLMKMGG